MSPRWTKIRRDMANASDRLLMIVVALAVSIAAVVTMMTASAVLMREVPRNYLGTNPASAQLELDTDVSEDLLRQVRQRPGIAAAEAASAVVGRIQVSPGEWMPLRVFVVPDLAAQRINRPDADTGAWPPATGAMLIERSALPLSRTAIGDSATIQLPHAGVRSVVIAGTVHDPGVAPAWQEQTIYAYASADTLASLGETPHLDLLKIVVSEGATDVTSIERTARDLSGWLTSVGYRVHEARIPPPGKHPHQGQMNGVIQMLLAFSLLALGLGAILAATIVGGLLAQHVRQIAIMKAIGASSRQIASLYLGMVSVLGLVALAIGLPLGIVAGRGFVTVVAELLNLRIESMALPAWLFGSTVLLGLGAPLLTASIPIALAARRTVRAAMDDHGIQFQPGRGGWLTRWHLRDASLTLALRTMFRRRTRLLLTLSLLAGAGAMFITSLNLKSAWESNVTQAITDRHFDIELGVQEDAPTEQLSAMAAAVRGVIRVESWSGVAASIAKSGEMEVVQRYPDGGHGGFALRSAPPDTTLIAHHMSEGRWLKADDTDGVVINSGARGLAFRGVTLGDAITLQIDHQPVRLTVVGFMRELLTPGAVYVTPAMFGRATGQISRSNTLRIALDASGRDRADAVAHEIGQALERDHIGVKSMITEKRFAAAEGGHVYILVFALGFIAIMMAVVGLLGLASALGTGIIERTREFGVLRAIGADSAAILKSVLAEGLMIGILSVFIALVFSLLLSAQVGRVLASISSQPLNPQLTASGALAWLAIVLVGSVLVSIIPARRAARLTIRETLSHT
ncbi:MAG: ABC transporter permease [Tahibacter sp.]